MTEHEVVNKKIALLALSEEEIRGLIPQYPRYFASAIVAFLANGKDFEQMTTLPKELRAELASKYIANPVSILRVFEGKSGTKKYLFNCSTANLSRAFLCRMTTATRCASARR